MRTVRLALLGDSIAYGVGATREADTLGPGLVRDLELTGRPAAYRVFAVAGARSADLGRQVTAATPWRPDVAVVVVGANDLTRFVAPDLAARQLGDAVRRLRAAGTQVVVAPAPDLSVVPHVPHEMRQLVLMASTRLREAQVNATLAGGGHVADRDGATTTAFAADPALFSGDLFHPSSAGYAVILRTLAPAVRAAVAVSEPEEGVAGRT